MLLADDEVFNHQCFNQIVKQFHKCNGNILLKVKSTYNGQQALDLVHKYWRKQKYFDLAILDRMMPLVSGDAVCREITEHALKHGLKKPALIISTAEQPDGSDDGEAQSLWNHTLPKPLTLNKVQTLINNWQDALTK